MTDDNTNTFKYNKEQMSCGAVWIDGFADPPLLDDVVATIVSVLDIDVNDIEQYRKAPRGGIFIKLHDEYKSTSELVYTKFSDFGFDEGVFVHPPKSFQRSDEYKVIVKNVSTVYHLSLIHI